MLDIFSFTNKMYNVLTGQQIHQGNEAMYEVLLECAICLQRTRMQVSELQLPSQHLIFLPYVGVSTIFVQWICTQNNSHFGIFQNKYIILLQNVHDFLQSFLCGQLPVKAFFLDFVQSLQYIFYSPCQENSSSHLGTNVFTIIQLTMSYEFKGPPLVLVIFRSFPCLQHNHKQVPLNLI